MPQGETNSTRKELITIVAIVLGAAPALFVFAKYHAFLVAAGVASWDSGGVRNRVFELVGPAFVAVIVFFIISNVALFILERLFQNRS